MPVCSKCGKTIACPGHAHGVSTEQSCGLDKGALWVQVVDDKGDGVTGADVTVDSGKQTGSQGLAAYDPLDAGSYTARLSGTLPRSVSSTHKPPTTLTKDAVVKTGEIAFVKFQLLKKQPKIEVVESHDFPEVVEGLNATHPIAIKNVGDADLVIDAVKFPALFPAGAGNTLRDGTTVAPGEQVDLEASFAPDLAGEKTGDLSIESNDPEHAVKVVKLSGKALAKWKLSVEVTSKKRAKIGDAPEAWPQGDIEVGVSADTDHSKALQTKTKPLRADEDGTFTLADLMTGNVEKTLYVWARAKDGSWFSRADAKVTLKPGETKTIAVAMVPLGITLELFRGDVDLTVIPFSTTDVPATLDAKLTPDTLHAVEASSRPTTLKDAFTFPPKSNFDDKSDANADPGLFRIRLRLDAVPEADAPTDAKMTLHVVTADGKELSDPDFGNATYASGTATHSGGMEVALEQDPSHTDAWLSPYMRVATTNVSPGGCAVVHSLGPGDASPPPTDRTSSTDCKAIMAAGKQFGRKLKVSGTLYGSPFAAEETMGGEPYARVPVKFLYASTTAPDNALKRITRTKVHQLNAWWAGQGLEFELVDPTSPLEVISAPPRCLLTIGEHTGPDHVSAVDFTLDLSVEIAATGKGPQEETVSIAVPKDKTPAEAAVVILGAIKRFRPAHSDNNGITVDGTIHDLGGPRGFQMLTPYDKGAQTLNLLGTRGPVDIALAAIGGVDSFEISKVAVSPGDQGIDIHAAQMKKPYHEAVLSPPAATTRQWARVHGGGTGDWVAVILEGDGHEYLGPNYGYPWKLCHPGYSTLTATQVEAKMVALLSPGVKSLFGSIGISIDDDYAGEMVKMAESKSRAVTLLNYGRWGEACGNFTIFLAPNVFQVGTDDVQHEMGHALADLDHTIGAPAWFYNAELLKMGSAEPAGSLKITRHTVHVAYLYDDSGTWKFGYKELKTGYGGAARERIGREKGGWVVNTGFKGWT